VSRGGTAVRTIALLAVVAATACGLREYVARPMQCVHRATMGATTLDRLEQRRDRPALLAAQRIRASLADCGCVSPRDARIFLTRGGAAALVGDAHAAIADYRRALAIDRRPEIYFNLGLGQLEALDRAGAIESFVTACAFDPARLADIPYDEIRQETVRRLVERYGADWLS
jgi:tetratricopeptide (TPR) repeat protein